MSAHQERTPDAFDVQRARSSRRPVVVFDIGGTWFRVGVFTGDGSVAVLGQTPAISFRTHTEPTAVLQQRMIEFIAAKVGEVRRAYGGGLDLVGVSLGAAMDGRIGRVLTSAPLWGPGRAEFSPADELARRLGGERCAVVNDVSALAYALLCAGSPVTGAMAAALTVSTGIAYRTIDLRSGHIPLDPDHGLQGEIGHLPAHFHHRGQAFDADCDCGAPNHVSSFSSGRGMERILRTLPDVPGLPQDRSGLRPEDLVQLFGVAVEEHRPGATDLLDAFTRPLAHVLLCQATLNPDVGGTVLTGGVADGLGDAYRESLLRNLNDLELYEISQQDPSYFSRRIVRGIGDGLDALRGAGIYARGVLDGEPVR